MNKLTFQCRQCRRQITAAMPQKHPVSVLCACNTEYKVERGEGGTPIVYRNVTAPAPPSNVVGVDAIFETPKCVIRTRRSRLQAQLTAAVNAENYERAAEIRDRINAPKITL